MQNYKLHAITSNALNRFYMNIKLAFFTFKHKHYNDNNKRHTPLAWLNSACSSSNISYSILIVRLLYNNNEYAAQLLTLTEKKITAKKQLFKNKTSP